MTSRTMSWSSTTRTVCCMPTGSPPRRPSGIPVSGWSGSARAVHTPFLLVRRLHGRPVRRDVGVAEVAVRDAPAGEELPVGADQLVDTMVEGHRALPRLTEPEALPDQRLAAERRARADREVVPADRSRVQRTRAGGDLVGR